MTRRLRSSIEPVDLKSSHSLVMAADSGSTRSYARGWVVSYTVRNRSLLT